MGTDIDAAALAVAEANLAAAHLGGGVAHALAARDFATRSTARRAAAAAGEVDATVSNPPLGQRVKVANLHALFADLFRLSATLLRPGRGRSSSSTRCASRRPTPRRAAASSSWGTRRSTSAATAASRWRRTEGP